jgi:hypothetical protein
LAEALGASATVRPQTVRKICGDLTSIFEADADVALEKFFVAAVEFQELNFNAVGRQLWAAR